MKYLLASWLIRKVMNHLLLQLEKTGAAAHPEVIVHLYPDGTFYVGVGNPSSSTHLGEAPACYEASSNTPLRAFAAVESMMQKERRRIP